MNDRNLSRNELSKIVDHLLKKHKQNMTEQSTLRNIILKLEAEVEYWRRREAKQLALIRDIKETLSNAPECDKYDDDDVIKCGWKSDMIRVRRLLEVVDNSDETE